MLDLSPTKLLIIFVVGVVLLGPTRLPQVARQLGAGWKKLREVHAKIDSEVRTAIPDLPSTQQLARYARSPVSLLNQLADLPTKNADGTAEPGATAEAAEPGGAGAGAGGAGAVGIRGQAPPIGSRRAEPDPGLTGSAAGGFVPPNDPSLN